MSDVTSRQLAAQASLALEQLGPSAAPPTSSLTCLGLAEAAEDADTNGALLERREALHTVAAGLGGPPLQQGQCAPRCVSQPLQGQRRSEPTISCLNTLTPADDAAKCCVCACERSGGEAGPSLRDTTMQPDGTVLVKKPTDDTRRKRRSTLVQTWCQSARRAAAAPALLGQHYLCEEHLVGCEGGAAPSTPARPERLACLLHAGLGHAWPTDTPRPG
jgi:hypothetical protein